jgi:hypothetical protein
MIGGMTMRDLEIKEYQQTKTSSLSSFTGTLDHKSACTFKVREHPKCVPYLKTEEEVRGR